MAISDLGTEKKTIVFGQDSVVIQKFNGGLKGGRTLDVTGVVDKYLYAGHVIIGDGNGVYKPLAFTATEAEGTTTKAYDAIPSGFSVVGILYRSIPVANPTASIMFDGEVNEEALPVPVTEAIKTALPNVSFIKDEAASV